MIRKSRFIRDCILYRLQSICSQDELNDSFYYANGCGAKGGVMFPGAMYFVSIISACVIHDIEWALSKNYQDLLNANERFDNNLKLITDSESSNSFTRWLRRLRIAKYITGVELVGTDAYAKERGFTELHVQPFNIV